MCYLCASQVIKMAHDAFARHRDKFRIGGCGFALPGSAWVAAFLDFYTASGMQFDFMSFHHYLGWTDATNPATYPGGSTALNLGYRNGVFHDLLAAKGLGGMPVVVSEYAWQDPSVTGAAGFGDPAKSARYTMTRWHSCARTLQVGGPSGTRATIDHASRPFFPFTRVAGYCHLYLSSLLSFFAL